MLNIWLLLILLPFFTNLPHKLILDNVSFMMEMIIKNATKLFLIVNMNRLNSSDVHKVLSQYNFAFREAYSFLHKSLIKFYVVFGVIIFKLFHFSPLFFNISPELTDLIV